MACIGALLVGIGMPPAEAVGQDCQPNGVTDDIDIADGTSQDCDSNLVPDECDIASGAPDCNQNSVPDGCETPAPAPQADFAVDVNTICSGEVVQFQNLSTGNNPAFSWDFGDGSTSADENPSHTYDLAGVHTVTLVVVDSCGTAPSQQVDLITVGASTVALFSVAENGRDACVGQPVGFTDLSTGANLTTFAWDFGDGNTSSEQNPSHTYDLPGDYTVQLSVEGSCGVSQETRVDAVTVTEPPVADFDVSATVVCVGDVVSFTNLTTGEATGYVWNFGDDGTVQDRNENPTHAYDTPGSYSVFLRAQSACGDSDATKSNLITVLATPVADFTQNATEICLGGSVQFTQTSSDAETFTWDFGDGGT